MCNPAGIPGRSPPLPGTGKGARERRPGRIRNLLRRTAGKFSGVVAHGELNRTPVGHDRLAVDCQHCENVRHGCLHIRKIVWKTQVGATAESGKND